MHNKNSGIYKITSKINPFRVYIGSSKYLAKRKTCHFSSLKNNTHKNRKIQRHANKYGIDDLSFDIIEYCDEDVLELREQHYINTIRPYFNLDPYARRAKGRKQSKQQIDLRILQHNKKVCQYELSGLFVKEWVSIVEASRFYNVSSSCLSGACRGRKKQIKGFQWRYDYQDKIDSCVVEKPIIAQYSLSGDLIKTWDSISSIVKSTGYGKTDIAKCFRGVSQQSHDYMWVKYQNNPIIKIRPYVNTTTKLIYQYSMDGELVREWSSLSSASRNTNINISSISSAASGFYKSAGGYLWYKQPQQQMQ